MYLVLFTLKIDPFESQQLLSKRVKQTVKTFTKIEHPITSNKSFGLRSFMQTPNSQVFVWNPCFIPLLRKSSALVQHWSGPKPRSECQKNFHVNSQPRTLIKILFSLITVRQTFCQCNCHPVFTGILPCAVRETRVPAKTQDSQMPISSTMGKKIPLTDDVHAQQCEERRSVNQTVHRTLFCNFLLNNLRCTVYWRRKTWMGM
jgi:hypothetical protein